MKATKSATGEQLAVYEEHDDTDVEEILTTAQSTFEDWGRPTPGARTALRERG